jgi:hypothetical protein
MSYGHPKTMQLGPPQKSLLPKANFMTGMFQYVLNKEDRRPQAAPRPRKKMGYLQEANFHGENDSDIFGVAQFLDKTLAVYGSLFQKWDGEAN